MSKTQTATEILQQLSAGQIRQRLAALESERNALRTLLRAAIRMEQGRKGGEVSK